MLDLSIEFVNVYQILRQILTDFQILGVGASRSPVFFVSNCVAETSRSFCLFFRPRHVLRGNRVFFQPSYITYDLLVLNVGNGW